MKSAVYEDIENPRDQVKTLRWLWVAALFVTPIGVSLGCSNNADSATTASGALKPMAAPVEQKPPSPEYLQQLETARVLLGENKAQESLPLLERCQQEQPESFAVHNNFCVAYAILRRRDEAVSACQHALKIDPSNQLAKNNLAWASSIQPERASP